MRPCSAADGQHFPAAPVAVIDTIGAGDAFSAGFLASWLGNDREAPSSLRKATAFAVRVAGLACAVRGATPPADVLRPADQGRRPSRNSARMTVEDSPAADRKRRRQVAGTGGPRRTRRGPEPSGLQDLLHREEIGQRGDDPCYGAPQPAVPGPISEDATGACARCRIDLAHPESNATMPFRSSRPSSRKAVRHRRSRDRRAARQRPDPGQLRRPSTQIAAHKSAAAAAAIEDRSATRRRSSRRRTGSRPPGTGSG